MPDTNDSPQPQSINLNDLTPDLVAFIKILQQREQQNKQLVDDALHGFKEKFPPAESKKDYEDSMTTQQIFNMLDNHLPGKFSVEDLPRQLSDLGYLSGYDPGEGSFAWLLQ